MDSSSLLQIQLTMAAGLFLIGMVAFIVGIVVLISRSASREVQTLAAQTTNLAQKGLAEEVAGLVGNASSLLQATNELIRTTAGVGVFLTLLGVVVMGIACWIVLQIR